MDFEDFSNTTWSATGVKAKLGLDNATFLRILDRLQKSLEDLGLLEQKVNITKARDRLRPAFVDNCTEFAHVFRNVPEDWKDRCLLFLIQRLNSSSRRRVKSRLRRMLGDPCDHRGSSEDPSDEFDERLSSSEAGKITRGFGSICVDVGYSTYSGTIYTMRDIQKSSIHTEPSSVDDLDFQKFISLVRSDLNFKDKRMPIVYVKPGHRKVDIRDERSWKAAMTEMLALGAERLSFTI